MNRRSVAGGGPAEDKEALAVPAAPLQLTPETLILRAIEAGTSVDALERLMAMRGELRREQAAEAFHAAMAAFQGECPVIPKTKTARVFTEKGSYEYHYAPLEVIVSEVAPLLAEHGLSYHFDTRFEAEPHPAQVVVCTIHHTLGHSERSEFRAPMDMGAKMNVMQKSASSLTYGKRYAFCDATGILTGDEDNDARTVDDQGEIRRRGRPAAREGVGEAQRARESAPQAAPTSSAAPSDDPRQRAGGEGASTVAEPARPASAPASPPAARPAGVGPQARRANVVNVPPQAPRAAEPPPTPQVEQKAAEAAPITMGDGRTLPEVQDGVPARLLELRQEARQLAAMLWQLRVEQQNQATAQKNKQRALNGQALLTLEPVPTGDISETSDEKLALYVESAVPGRKLVELDEGTLEVLVGSLRKMGDTIAQKIASSGPPPEPQRS
jgi:hypothetical protein